MRKQGMNRQTFPPEILPSGKKAPSTVLQIIVLYCIVLRENRVHLGSLGFVVKPLRIDGISALHHCNYCIALH